MRTDRSPPARVSRGQRRALECLPWARIPQFHPFRRPSVAKPNYHQARKQKELARKARQQEKQQRRAARPETPGVDAMEATETPGAARDPLSGSGA